MKRDGRANGLNNKGYPLRKIVEEFQDSDLHLLECGHILARVSTAYVRWRRCPECKGESLPCSCRTWRIVVSVYVENDNKENLRAFPNVQAACKYVDKLVARLARLVEKGKTDIHVASATVYKVQPSGCLRTVATFEANDPRDNYYREWSVRAD